jgi:hypothetical protein
MNRLRSFLSAVAFAAIVAGDCGATDIILCDQKTQSVLVVPENADWNDGVNIEWSWSGKTAPDIRPEHGSFWFTNLTDAKPVLGMTHLLITASGGGVALVRIEDRKAVFYNYAGPNAHSAEILPDSNIVAACSTVNYLRIFSTLPDSACLVDYPVPDAHGVVWDNERQLLWVLGISELRSYRYNFNRAKPELTLERSYPLPSPGGHDLFPSLRGHTIYVTTWEHVWEFDPTIRAFSGVLTIHETHHVKSVCDAAVDGRTAYLQACENWWCDTIRFTSPEGEKQMSGARFYKMRWMVSNPFGESVQSKQ